MSAQVATTPHAAAFPWRLLIAVGAFWLHAGCDQLPGRPDPADRPIRPDQVADFGVLYANNCAGCHGPDGRGGAAVGLANPVYLAIVDDQTLRTVIANGVAGTPMPAFARSAGGSLTDAQIDILVQGVRHWTNGNALGGATPPPYAATTPGNAAGGTQVFETFCASCHGASGTGGERAGSVVDNSYLALVSNQSLRTLVIAGRPEFDHPDWRGYVAGKALTPENVSDVVAWLAAKRTAFPGQPYPVGQ